MEKKVKLIIEIGESDYEAIKNDGVQSHIALADEVIANGTVITDDCISRSALREKISNAFIEGAKKSIFKKYIDNAPTYGKEMRKNERR